MKVILTKDVDALGDSGDVLSVSDGYARNYLFPKNYAVEATEGALKDLQQRIDRIRAKAEKKYQDDLEKARKVEELALITIEANAGESGKLFGTITTKQLAQVLNEKTGLEVERKQLNVNNPINKVGDYILHVRFSSKVTVELKIDVVAAATAEKQSIIEEVEAAEQAEALALEHEAAEETVPEEV